MTIPAHARGMERNSIIRQPLEEIQVGTVLHPESNGISFESKLNHFLILHDRYWRIFRTICLRDKASEACIDDTEQPKSTFGKNIKKISHITRSDAGLEFWSDTFRKLCKENKIKFETSTPKHQEQNGLVERHWGTIIRFANDLLLHARLKRKISIMQ